mmetsp:Transcript_29023/g.56832  ORF Transcript_29023/g.56832 Transcript_29023/m.56832 type:complete len:82 (-) Transcript_29023:260-505(-)
MQSLTGRSKAREKEGEVAYRPHPTLCLPVLPSSCIHSSIDRSIVVPLHLFLHSILPNPFPYDFAFIFPSSSSVRFVLAGGL